MATATRSLGTRIVFLFCILMAIKLATSSSPDASKNEKTNHWIKLESALLNTNAKQDWKLIGLESASLHLDRNYNNKVNYRSPRDNCPEDCKCGIITGITCYAPSDDSLPPKSLPLDTQVLTLYGYKVINEELKGFNELQELSIYDGNLPSFPVLPNSLTHLRITNSKLKTTKNIDDLSYLQSLNVAHNNLTDIDLSSLGHLLSLDLSHNPLERVPGLPTSLTILKMKNANLNKQPTTWEVYLPNLRHLILTGILSSQPPYLSLPKLEYLDLSHSGIKLLPYLSGLPNLKEIDISHTQIIHAVPGHFEGPNNLKKVDLSFTRLSTLPDKLFINNLKLEEIHLHNSEIEYIKDYTFSGLRKLVKLILRDNTRLEHIDDKSLSTLDNLKIIDISRTSIKALPYSLYHTNLTKLISNNVSLLCDCHSHWLPNYLMHAQKQTALIGLLPIKCSDGHVRTIEELDAHLDSLMCSAPEIISAPDMTLRRGVGKTALLECNSTGVPFPTIVWLSPDKKYYTYNHTENQPWFSDKLKYMFAHVTDASSDPPIDPRIQPLKSGQLLIQNLTRDDVGLYRCTAVNDVASVTSTTSLWLTVAELEAFKIQSLLFGLACAMTFLLTTLIVQLIRYIMDRMGWECCCCRGRISSKAMQVKKLLENVESYKSQQLDKLKENYNSQVVTIKESCYQQMEKLSEGYSQQCKNLQSIKDYSAQQLTTARDQYVDQINRCRDYSVGQMNKVGENYVFQRQRIRKFSAHQLFKLRETYKYQQKTLNKILENIPDLYLQNCRTGGNCNRADSIIFDDEIHGIDAYYRLDFLNPIISNEGSEDFYYTPSSTLTKAQRQYIVEQHRRQHSNCSTIGSTNDYHEAVQSWATNTPTLLSPTTSPSHPMHTTLKHTRSLSITTPKSNPGSNNSSKSYVPTHRRAFSANINFNPPVKIHRSSPPLVEKTYWTPLAKSPSASDCYTKSEKRVAGDLSKLKDERDYSDIETEMRSNSDGQINRGSSRSAYIPLPTEPQFFSSNNKSDINISPKTDKFTVDNKQIISDVRNPVDSGIVLNTENEENINKCDPISTTDTDINSVVTSTADDTRSKSPDKGTPNTKSSDAHTSDETSSPNRRDKRKTILSRDGSKELEGRCVLAPVSEDNEPCLSASEIHL